MFMMTTEQKMKAAEVQWQTQQAIDYYRQSLERRRSIGSREHHRKRFEAKGRLQLYLAAIPTYVIVRPLSALVGAAALLERSDTGVRKS